MGDDDHGKREKRKKEAEGKLIKINDLRQTVEQFDRTAKQNLDEKLRMTREKILKEIKDVINTKSKAGAFTLVLDQCRAELGAAGAALYLIAGDGVTLELLGDRGYPAGHLQRFAAVPLAEVSPGGDAIRAMTPLFFEDVGAFLARYPAYTEGFQRDGFDASAALPLIAHDQPIGVLALRFGQHHG